MEEYKEHQRIPTEETLEKRGWSCPECGKFVKWVHGSYVCDNCLKEWQKEELKWKEMNKE